MLEECDPCGGGLYSGRSGRGAPPAYPVGGRPMAPAPAAGWMVGPNVQGPYHTSDPSPTAGQRYPENLPILSLKGRRAPGPSRQRAEDAGPIKAAVWAARPSITPRLGPVDTPQQWPLMAMITQFPGRVCTSVEVQALRPQGIAGTEKPARGIDVPGK